MILNNDAIIIKHTIFTHIKDFRESRLFCDFIFLERSKEREVFQEKSISIENHYYVLHNLER